MSVALNLSKKLEWMSRRLRWIDDAAEIQQWVSAMTAINKLLKGVSKEKETYTDGWRPWKEQDQLRQNAKWDEREATGRHMDVDAGVEDTEEADTVLKEAKHKTENWSFKEKAIMDDKKKAVLKMLDPQLVLPPRVEVGEDEIKSTLIKRQDEFKRVVLTAMNMDKGVGSEEAEEAEEQVIPTDVQEEMSQYQWREALIKRLEVKRYHGCAYKGWLGEWHPTDELLRDIAVQLDRNYDKEMTDSLRNYLVVATATYHKEKGF